MNQANLHPPCVAAVLSMLHELPGRPDSATRRFHGRSPLAWTLDRLRRSPRIAQTAVLCWEDQWPTVQAIADQLNVQCFPVIGGNLFSPSGCTQGEGNLLSPSPCTQGEGRGEGASELDEQLSTQNHPHPNPLPEYRERGQEGNLLSPSPCTQGEGRGEGASELDEQLSTQNHPHPNPLPEYRERGQERISLPQLDAVAAARRWADGWRGGLLSSCEFDRGFHGPWLVEILHQLGADAALLVDPSAGLVDPVLIDALIDHAAAHDEVDFCFSPAAPGLSGVLLRGKPLQQLAAAHSHPGTMLAYRPDLPMRDPISSAACAPIAAALARTTERFTLDSRRQIDRLASATAHLNGQLMATDARQLLQLLHASPTADDLPRDLILELNVRRIARPIFWPGSHLDINRREFSLENAKTLFHELARADDMRLTIAGAGDPLLHDEFFQIVDCAHRAGIAAIAIQTDLLGIDATTIERLVDLPLDIISVHLPAISAKTYLAVMGIDGLGPAMENLARLMARRQSRRRGTPLIVPTFVKTAVNLAEMERWYDHWLGLLGCAVIAGPEQFAGQIPDLSAAQMEPPQRRPCARIQRRLSVLSDGRIVACEQDCLGQNPLGDISCDSIKTIWTGIAATLRRDHAEGNWQRHRLCAACRDWHRP